MWVRIRTVVMLTLVGILTSLPTSNNCFELLGLDILVDQNLKPWLLEINASPALSIDGAIDEAIKPNLIRDLVSIVKQDIKKLNSKYVTNKTPYTSKFASTKTSRPNSAIRTNTPKSINPNLINESQQIKRNYQSSLSQSKSTNGFFQTGLTTSMTPVSSISTITPKSRLLSSKRNSSNARIQLSKKMVVLNKSPNLNDRQSRQMIPPIQHQKSITSSQSSSKQMLGFSNSNSITLSNTSTATTTAQSTNQRPPTSICIGKTGIKLQRESNAGILDRMTNRMLTKVEPECDSTKQEVDQFLSFLLTDNSSMSQFEKLLKNKIKQDYNQEMRQVVEARRKLQFQPLRAVKGLHHQEFKSGVVRTPSFTTNHATNNVNNRKKKKRSIIVQQQEKSEINDSVDTMRSTHSGLRIKKSEKNVRVSLRRQLSCTSKQRDDRSKRQSSLDKFPTQSSTMLRAVNLALCKSSSSSSSGNYKRSMSQRKSLNRNIALTGSKQQRNSLQEMMQDESDVPKFELPEQLPENGQFQQIFPFNQVIVYLFIYNEIFRQHNVYQAALYAKIISINLALFQSQLI